MNRRDTKRMAFEWLEHIQLYKAFSSIFLPLTRNTSELIGTGKSNILRTDKKQNKKQSHNSMYACTQCACFTLAVGAVITGDDVTTAGFVGLSVENKNNRIRNGEHACLNIDTKINKLE